MELKAKIEGVTPLIMNRFTDEAQLTATEGNRSATNGERLTPHEDAESRLYTHENQIIMPSENLSACWMNGGKFFKSGRSKITTQRSSLVPAALIFSQPYFAFKSGAGWKVDSRPVRIPATGGRILRHRPMFDDWSIEISAELDTEVISKKMMRDIVDAAGKKIGLGDFRPECRGPFGRFVVTNWKIS